MPPQLTSASFAMRSLLLVKCSVIRDIMPCGLMNVNQHFGGSKKPVQKQQLFSSLAFSLTLKMEATCLSETSVDFQWSTWCYIPEGRILHNHSYEDLKIFYQCSLHTFTQVTLHGNSANSHK
jgi:hypothetical protein